MTFVLKKRCFINLNNFQMPVFHFNLIARYIFWPFLAVFVGFAGSFGILKIADYTYNLPNENQNRSILAEQDKRAVPQMPAALPVSTPNEPAKQNAALIFVGDMMFGRGVENFVFKKYAGDFSRLFDNTKFIKDADIAFGNLEGPISDKGGDLRNLYSFRFDPAVLVVLKEAGFDALSVANNHIGDWGKDAFEDTILRLADEGIVAIGGGKDFEDAAEVKIIEKNNTRFGFLGFSDVGPNWLEVKSDSSGILLAKEDEIPFLIREAASKADILIVSFHFGEEYQEIKNSRQKMLAHLAIDNGAKIVIGHHPHVAQEIEYYNGGIIAYSLGNFIFDQNFSKETMQGLVLEVLTEKNKIISAKSKAVELNNFFQPQSR